MNQSPQWIINTQIIQRKWLSTSAELNPQPDKAKKPISAWFLSSNTSEPSQTQKNNTIYNTLRRLRRRRRLDSDTGAEDQVQWESMIVHTTIARWTIFPRCHPPRPHKTWTGREKTEQREWHVYLSMSQTTRRAVSFVRFSVKLRSDTPSRYGWVRFRSQCWLVGRAGIVGSR